MKRKYPLIVLLFLVEIFIVACNVKNDDVFYDIYGNEDSDVRVDEEMQGLTDMVDSSNDASLCVEVYDFEVDLGQLMEGGEFYNKYVFEENGYTEIHINYFYVDITHDGVLDLVETVTFCSDVSMSINDAVNEALLGSFVKVYKGIDDESYETEACFVSRGFDNSHAGNGAICLVTFDSKDYLMISNLWEGQGIADYNFVLFYVDDESGINIIDKYGVKFSIEEEVDSDNASPEKCELLFDECIGKYIDKAVILFAMDIDFEAIYSDSGNIVLGEEYYYRKLVYLK